MLELDSPNLQPGFGMPFGIKEVLERRGYTLVEKIGEGATREVYKARLARGKLSKDVVVKIPKLNIKTDSATTRVNMARRNMDDSELVAVSGPAHRCIVGVLDAISLGERTITVEEHFRAKSLEDFVGLHGPLDDEDFRKVFTDVLSGLDYLHNGRQFLHRDLKPSNILVSYSLEAKLTDLQNAGPIFGKESTFPTRGGTAYTDPEVLNAIMSGNLTSYGSSSEIFALGATMFYALTGEHLFDRTLTIGDSPHVVHIGDEKLGLILRDNKIPLSFIDLVDHNKHVKRQMKKVPRKYRGMIRRCLDVIDPLNPSYPIGEIKDSLDLATTPTKTLISRTAKSIKLWGTVFAGVAGALAGLGHINYWNETHPLPEIRMYEMLRATMWEDVDLTHLEQTNPEMLKTLQPYFATLRESYYPGYLEDLGLGVLESRLSSHSNFKGMSSRSNLSLLRAIYMQDKESRDSVQPGTFESTLLPIKFAVKRERDLGNLPVKLTEDMMRADPIAYTVDLLKICMLSEQTLPDVYGCYFLDPEDRFDAKVAAGTPFYFTENVEEENPLSLEPQFRVVPEQRLGYSEYLTQPQRDIINTAVALYLLSDNEGRVYTELINEDGTLNWDRVDGPVPPDCSIGGLTGKTGIKPHRLFVCKEYHGGEIPFPKNMPLEKCDPNAMGVKGSVPHIPPYCRQPLPGYDTP